MYFNIAHYKPLNDILGKTSRKQKHIKPQSLRYQVEIEMIFKHKNYKKQSL